jgi:hypothetical protein
VEQRERALGVGQSTAADDKVVDTLARQAEFAGEVGFLTVSPVEGSQSEREFVPEWGIGSRFECGAAGALGKGASFFHGTRRCLGRFGQGTCEGCGQFQTRMDRLHGNTLADFSHSVTY